MPALGQGTWTMGEDKARAKEEVRILRVGIELGMTLIDTAELYADGGAEEIVGEAIRGRRGDVFLVSKVVPENATRSGVEAACERSLKRLGSDFIDLYLLHWNGAHPLSEVVEAFEKLKASGKIKLWGVSNFDTTGLQELSEIEHGENCSANQVLYNVSKRGIEFDLKPQCIGSGMPIMAYCPLDEGRLLAHPALAAIGERKNATPAQVALAFILSQPSVIAIPKSSRLEHVWENRESADFILTPADLAELDQFFPPPRKKTPLAKSW